MARTPGGPSGYRFGACTDEACLRPAINQQGWCDYHSKLAYNRNYQNTSNGKHVGLTDEQVAEAKRMRAAFKTNREIATHFGVSLDTLRKAMKR